MTKAVQPSIGDSVLIFQVDNINFANTETGWCAVRTTAGAKVSGKFKAQLGKCFKATGKWVTHPKFGPQFEADTVAVDRFSNPQSLAKFLAHQVAGFGLGSAQTLADELGEDLEHCLDTLDQDRIAESVGKRKAALILAVWPKIKPAADMITPLLSYGLTEAMADTLVNAYGHRAIQIVEEEPYSLILRVDGISFLTADRIAAKIGIIGKTDPVRLRAALNIGMRDATANGDIGVPRKTLLKKTMLLVNPTTTEGNTKKLTGVIDVEPLVLADTLAEMLKSKDCGFANRIMEFPDEAGEMVVWYTPLIYAEERIARRLAKFDAAPHPDLVSRVADFAAKAKVKLAPEQQAAIEMALNSPVSVITGGPGVGKSFLLKGVLAALDGAGGRGYLAAPTGKAAKRITESTGRPAQTMHSLLGVQPGKDAMYNLDKPLEATYLVIDEVSMVDTTLMADAVEAIPHDCRLIIVGDVDQLASVGPGQVLRDLIRSGLLPVTRLTKIFRQGAGSGIVTAAQQINKGLVPSSSPDGQFKVVDTETPAQDLIAALKAMIKSGVNADTVQALSPTHRGDAGCTSLNKAIQALLNPEPTGGTKERLRRDSGDIRVGDRVIQNKNDKALGIVNGDIGWVESIGSDGVVTLILADREKPVIMPAQSTTHLKLAYCITVHKSQGAEAPHILLALDATATFMLRRNLIYTGVTRASQQVRLFAPERTLSLGIRSGEPPEGSRRTSLVSKLKAAFGPPSGKTGLVAPMPDDDDDIL